MNKQQATGRRDAVLTQMKTLIEAHPDGLAPDQLEEFERCESEVRTLDEKLAVIERAINVHPTTDDLETHARSGSREGVGLTTYVPGDPFAPPSQPESGTQVRSRAIAAVARWDADDELKHNATRTLERLDRDESRGVAAHLLRYSHPLYVAAFRKYTAAPDGSYVADLTREEAAAWREAREYQRATLDTTGAVLPSPLDPAITLTNDGTNSPMRQAARVDTTASLSKRYITSAGSSFSFDAEGAEVSDDTHTETEVTITTHKGQGYIEASMEAAMDQPNFDIEVARIIRDGKDRLEGEKFVTGTGTNEPFGIETALAGTAAEVAATGEALTADDVYALLESLPPRFRPDSRWQLEMSTRNFLHRLHNPSGNEPALIEGDRLLGRPYVLNSDLDPYSAVDATATASNRVLYVGDWAKGYTILDRVGTQVHYLQPGIIQGANGRPNGKVGWYATWRVGADVITPSAFKMLSVNTTA